MRRRGRQISIHAPPRGATFPFRGRFRPFAFQFTPLREGRRACRFLVFCGFSFQFTPLREGRHGSRGHCVQSPEISIHAPPRGATSLFFFVGMASADFNSRPSARGDTSCSAQAKNSSYFNSRPSARGDRFVARFVMRLMNFNSRPSARGDAAAKAAHQSVVISIHAPPRGATKNGGYKLTDDRISIHAPPRGATLRHGRRARSVRISIHAPPRGATLPEREKAGLVCHFNSRPSARGDQVSDERAELQRISIHAPPRGATRRGCEYPQGADYFNSRPSARGDKDGMPSGKTEAIFQFTPLREGRRCQRSNEGPESAISIHAPPRGATEAGEAGEATSGRFQFTPLREGRQQKICNFCKSFVQPLQISMA